MPWAVLGLIVDLCRTHLCTANSDLSLSSLGQDSVWGSTYLACPVVMASRPLPFGNSAFGTHTPRHTQTHTLRTVRQEESKKSG